MATHEYTPDEALVLLMQGIRASSEDVAEHIQGVIDLGRDIVETEPSGGKRKKPRSYRRTVAYSPDEALQVAVEALRAYFIEQNLFINSVMEYFRMTAIGSNPTNEAYSGVEDYRGLGEEKEILIELQTETQISPSTDPTRHLTVVSHADLEDLQALLNRILELTDFR